MSFEIKGNYFNGDYQLPIIDTLRNTVKVIKKHNPSNTSQKLWELTIDYNCIDDVIESSIKGFEHWRKTPVKERLDYLSRFKEIVQKKQDQIAEAIAMETGKPLWESLTEAKALAAKVDVTTSKSLSRISKQEFSNIMPKTDGQINFKPIGPCFVIGPFNFPCHLANGQILNALVAGNSIIFKPSEKTCFSGQLLIDCFHEAGFPKGVINLIQGDGETASRITKNKNIKGIFFTGSKEVGLKIIENTYKDLSKLVALELGGKNTSIIHHDANLDLVLPELLKACFMTTGQRCVSTSLVPIHESIADKFIEKFHSYTKRLIIDHPIEFEATPFMGPLIDEASLKNYLNYMGMAKREGFEEIMRGKKLDKNHHGHYVTPSIHLGTMNHLDNSIFITSELFGPNCTFIKYKDIEEAIKVANHSEYGLAGSVFTQDKTIQDLCIRDVEVGQFNINRSTVGASSALPFGGVKSSGNYRPAAVSFIDSCSYPQSSLELKEVTIENPDSIVGVAKA